MNLHIADWYMALSEDSITLPSGDVLDNRDRSWQIKRSIEIGPKYLSKECVTLRRDFVDALQLVIHITFYLDGKIYSVQKENVERLESGRLYRVPIYSGPWKFKFFRCGAIGAKLWAGSSVQWAKTEYFSEKGRKILGNKVDFLAKGGV